jgi:hypothetical protein
MPLKEEKTVILDKGIESFTYTGAPLPSSFSLAQRIDFYLNEHKTPDDKNNAGKSVPDISDKTLEAIRKLRTMSGVGSVSNDNKIIPK